MNYLDLFHGIGGFALSAYWAGMKFENHYCSDIEPYAVELYKKRFPDSIQLGDINNHKEWKLEKGKYIITAGFPCQPFSVSGRRKRRADHRYLWPILLEFIQCRQPCICLFENVTAIDNGDPVSVLEEIYNDLENENYETLPPLEIPASSFYSYHKRNRVWIIAYSLRTRWTGSLRSNIGRIKEKNIQADALDTQCNTFLQFEKRVGKPAVLGVDDGIPNRVDRLKGLGNSIVPQIAELLFRQIKEQIE